MLPYVCEAWKGLSMIASVVFKSHCWLFSDCLGKGMYTLNAMMQVKEITFGYIKLEMKFRLLPKTQSSPHSPPPIAVQ